MVDKALGNDPKASYLYKNLGWDCWIKELDGIYVQNMYLIIQLNANATKRMHINYLIVVKEAIIQI